MRSDRETPTTPRSTTGTHPNDYDRGRGVTSVRSQESVRFGEKNDPETEDVRDRAAHSSIDQEQTHDEEDIFTMQTLLSVRFKEDQVPPKDSVTAHDPPPVDTYHQPMEHECKEEVPTPKPESQFDVKEVPESLHSGNEGTAQASRLPRCIQCTTKTLAEAHVKLLGFGS